MALFEQFFQDLRHGARAALRTPGFTLTAVTALALGIGANTAIFSVIDAVLLRPLPYRDAQRLVTILHNGNDPAAPANYFDWRARSSSFENIGAAEAWGPSLTGVDEPERLKGLHVTASLWPVLGVQPLLGHWPEPDINRTVMLSYALWQRRFAGDAGVLGKKVTLDGEPYAIVGVMPREFRFAPFWATHAELWAPLDLQRRAQDRGGSSLRVFARLKDGVTLAHARAEIAAITSHLEQQYPGTNRNVTVTPLREKVAGKVQMPLLLLFGAVGFVLLIACANVAHMLLARAAARQKEMAVRTALGAGRGRIVRQLLTENALLAVLGSAAGLLLAIAGTRALVALSPADIPRVETVQVSTRALLFLLGTSVLTCAIFGLLPALRTAAVNPVEALKESGSGGGGPRHNRVRAVLVASQFALAVMLLAGAGLMLRTFHALASVDPGFRPRHVLSMVVSVAGSKEAPAGRRAVFYRALLDRVRVLPGVEAAGAINHLPLAGDLWGLNFQIEGRPKPRPGEAPSAVYRVVMPGYFETMRLPIMIGRDIDGSDTASAPSVAVINETAARRYWPGEQAVGKHIAFSDGGWITIVGIAKDARQGAWAASPQPEIYVAALQRRDFLGDAGTHTAYITLVVRSAVEPGALAREMKSAVWALDPNLPISEVQTMQDVVSEANAQPRFEMLLLTAFAALALILAAIGIYGVVSYAVSRRTREIAIRMSLGASGGAVLALIVRQGMMVSLAGAGVGLAGALLLSRLMSAMLYGVRPRDPATLAGVAVTAAAVALIASYIPALRAVRIDAATALREQ